MNRKENPTCFSTARTRSSTEAAALSAARSFAREGAKVHLAGRTPEKLEAVADE
jgi:hypothetical protein